MSGKAPTSALPATDRSEARSTMTFPGLVFTLACTARATKPLFTATLLIPPASAHKVVELMV